MTISDPRIFGDENGVYAKIIADSITGDYYPHRLTTMEVQCHRFVLSEFNTHRKFSRNSASSRAIPVQKQIDRVLDNPAIPISFPREISGMQGGEELPIDDQVTARATWLAARRDAVSHARNLVEQGVHKSVVNRLLEPFMWHKIIVSSTEWQNFFDQRVSPLAQPEIRAVAECMQQALYHSTPGVVKQGQWHLPYTSMEERVFTSSIKDVLKISAARCARVSYLTHDGIRDIEKDIELFDKLVSANPPHWSPLEHVARPLTDEEKMMYPLSNFDGWTQLRHIDLEKEGLV